MGRSKQIGKAKQHKRNRLMKVKTAFKDKDLDQIQDDMKPGSKTRSALMNQPVDLDMPGMGQHYCLACSYVLL